MTSRDCEDSLVPVVEDIVSLDDIHCVVCQGDISNDEGEGSDANMGVEVIETEGIED